MRPVVQSVITKQSFLAFTVSIASLLFGGQSLAQTNTWDGSSSANWNTAANWSLNQVPTASHDVVIPNSVAGANDNPIINTAAVCSSLTLSGGNQAITLSISGANSLTVTNGITIGSGTGNGDDKIIAVNAGSLSCASITMNTTGNDNRFNGLTISTGTATISGSIIMNDADPDRNIVSITSSGTLNVAGSVTGGDLLTSASSTVNYNGGTQTVRNVAYNGNLTLSGTGAKDLSGITTIGGNFVISNTATTMATAGLTIGGAVTLSAGTSFTSGAFTHSIAGNWVNNGGTFNGAGSTINLNGAAQSIGGSSSTTFNHLTLAGSNTKIFSIPTFTTGILFINTGVVANLGTFVNHTANALAFGGAGQIAGTWGSTASAATNQINTFFTAASVGILTVVTKAASTYYTRQTGNWNSNATWSTVTYGNATNTGTFPVAGDVVNIGGGNFTITVNVTSACGSLNYQGNTSNSPIVSISAGITLDVSGAIDIPSAPIFDGALNTLAVGAGTLNAGSISFSTNFFSGLPLLSISTGTVTVSGDVTSAASFITFPRIVFTGAGLMQVGGAFLDSSNATLTPGTGTVEYNGTVAQTIGDFTYNNLTLSGSNVKTAAGSLDINGAITLSPGINFTAGAFTHTVAGSWTNNGATFTNTNSTISLDGAAQTIGGSSTTTFNNLTLAGSGTKTFGLSTTIARTLEINTSVVANLGSITTHSATTLAFNSVGQVPGTWGSTASVATNQNNTFFTAASTGIVNVTNRIYYTRQTGNWNSTTTWSTVTYGNATNSGTFPVAGDIVEVGGGNFTITVNVASACAFLSYQGNTGNSPIVSLSAGIPLDVSGNIDIPSAPNFNGALNTLAVGAGTLNAGSITFSTNFFSGLPLLSISTGTVTVSGDVTSNASFITFPRITFTGAGLLRVAGAFLDSSNGTLTPSTGTVQYNGTTAQTIGDFTYYNLTLNNLSGSIPQLTLIGNTTATNSLVMTSGVVDLAGFTFTLGASGAASTLTRTASTTTNWMYDGSFTRFWPTGQTPSPTTGNFYGLFPLGHSSSFSYRPVQITAGSNISTTGSVTFTHVDATTTTDLSPVYNDAGTNIVRKHNSQFIGSTTGVVGGANYAISVTMTGLATGTASDIRLAISNGATTVTNAGTHTANTGTASNPVVGRSGLSLADLSNDFRITTINLINTPLPIELLSFTAEIEGGGVELRWATASELNNDFFTVERSNGGEIWSEVINVAGAGTSTVPKNYRTQDDQPLPGTSYYRLRQTDFDGEIGYSPIVKVDFKGHKDAVVYPNPSSGKFTITNLESGVQQRVRVTNSLGQFVAATIAFENNLIVVDLQEYPAGTYFIQIAEGTKIQTIRAVKY